MAVREIFKGLDVAHKRFPKNTARATRAYVSETTCLIKLNTVGSKAALPLIDRFETDDAYHVITPWASRGTVALSHLNLTAVEKEQETACIARDLMYALNDLASAGIVHCDVKPANTVFTDSGVAFIDFEDAHFLSRDSYGQRHTISFMSPEMMRSVYVPESDVWSAGVTIFVLLTGRLPFRSKQNSQRQVLRLIQESEPDYCGISKNAADFMRCCLAKDHAKRPSALQLLSHPWLQDF